MHEKARSHKKGGTTLLTAVALLLSLGPSPSGGRPVPAGQAGGPPALYARALPSVGFIYLRDPRDVADRPPRPKACAAVVRGDGVIVTGYRAICRDNSEALYDEIFFELPEIGGRGELFRGARRYRLKPALIDKSYDLALLRVARESAEPFDLPPVALADSLGAQLLDELAIIGFAEKGVPSLSIYEGVVEGIDRLENWIRTDARLLRGGAGVAVTAEGKLLGIPAKVIVDSQAVDGDGDGRPDAVRQFGAVAFLRPAHLVASMLNRLGESEARVIQKAAPESLVASSSPPPAQASEAGGLVAVKGMVRSAPDGKSVAGARVGLVAAGSASVTSSTLLAWGGTNPEGRFNMNRRVPPGLYTVRAVALGYEPLTMNLDVDERMPPLVIDLRRAK